MIKQLLTRMPWSRTKIQSISSTVEIRCAIVKTVVSWHSMEMAFCRTNAVCVSTLAVHSSKQSICKKDTLSIQQCRLGQATKLHHNNKPYYSQPSELSYLGFSTEHNKSAFSIFIFVNLLLPRPTFCYDRHKDKLH